MKIKGLILLLITIGIISCNQEKTANSPVNTEGEDTLTIKQTDLQTDSVIDKSFTSNNEKFLRFEMIVNKSLTETWRLFSTEAGMKIWAAPVVKMDLRVGGSIQTNYDSTAKIGDQGTISLGITNYFPNEMITFKVELNEVFPKICREQDQNLQEVVHLEPVSLTQTKIISTMTGWGKGKEWDQTYSFFQKGNKWSYEQLIKQIR